MRKVSCCPFRPCSVIAATLPALVFLAVTATVVEAEEGTGHGSLASRTPSKLTATAVWTRPLMPVLRRTSSGHHVPLELMLVLGRLGSGFENRGAEPTIEGGYGIMALRENILGANSLNEAARLLKQDPEQLKINPYVNIEGAAAVLEQYAVDTQINPADGLDAWWPVVVKYAGLGKDIDLLFAWEAFSMLREGFTVTNSLGEVFSVAPQAVRRELSVYEPKSVMTIPSKQTATPTQEVTQLLVGCSCAVWNAAATCDYSATYTAKDTIIIHTAEGSYAGTISWFQNCTSQVSAHYVVAYDGRITQMVDENYKAWHVGCLNSRSVGIEHEGYAASATHPTAQYDASANLSRDICNRWGVPKAHNLCPPGILGHIDANTCVCGPGHTDPGSGWNWAYYIGKVNGDDAQMISNTIPILMRPDKSYAATVTVKNIGATTWTSDVFKLGAVGDSDPFASSRQAMGISSVSLGGSATFSFNMTAPHTPGVYKSDWQMVHEVGKWFGQTLSVNVNVVSTVRCDFDLDRDVDQYDFQHFTSCITGPKGLALPAGCEDADLDGDGDIDQADFGLIQGCLTGQNVPVILNCMK